MIRNYTSYAVLALLTAMLLNATTDVLVKWLAASHSILQIIFFRNLFSLIPVAVVVMRDGGLPSLRSDHVLLNILRALLGLASMVLYVISFTLMPLANVIAIGFVAPLILVVLCKVFLREPVSVAQWAAVTAGCCGALIIVHPDFEILQWRALLPVAGAFFLAAYMLLLRILSRTETRSSLIVYFPVVSIICAGAALPWVSTMPDRTDFLLLVITGCIGGIALYLRNEAYTAAPASELAPCEYTGLLWVAIFGVAVFGDRLSQQLIIGATILIGTNLLVLARAARLSSRTAS